MFFIVGEVFQFDAMLGFPRQGFRGLDGGAKLIERGSGDPKFGERGQVGAGICQRGFGDGKNGFF